MILLKTFCLLLNQIEFRFNLNFSDYCRHIHVSFILKINTSDFLCATDFRCTVGMNSKEWSTSTSPNYRFWETNSKFNVIVVRNIIVKRLPIVKLFSYYQNIIKIEVNYW